MSTTGGGEPVGSVGDEAVKLLQALQDWARDSSHGPSGGGDGRGVLGDFSEHIATGGQDCRYCPICQVISTVRATSPEVKQHLTTAATSLLHAAAALLATHVPDEGRRSDAEEVEHIELDDPDGWEEED